MLRIRTHLGSLPAASVGTGLWDQLKLSVVNHYNGETSPTDILMKSLHTENDPKGFLVNIEYLHSALLGVLEKIGMAL